MPGLFTHLPASWQPHLAAELTQPYVAKLEAFLAAEGAAHTIFPPEHQVFRALELTPFERTAVVILGQDPYHGAGQAHGLAFSVQPGVKPPPSLMNMYKELEADLGLPRPNTGFLEPWAQQGVLLLNTALTVRANEANSHAKQGWERLTDAIIRAVANRAEENQADRRQQARHHPVRAPVAAVRPQRLLRLQTVLADQCGASPTWQAAD
jgi:uracil-DNA glycosylase